MFRSNLTAWLLLLTVWCLVPTVRACPMCQEAVPNTSSVEEEDQARLARAFNNSILLMVGMPYALVGGVGWLIYRQVRLRARLEASRTDRPLSPGSSPSQRQGDLSCPTRSVDAGS